MLVDVLFNGKTRPVKERYDGHPFVDAFALQSLAAIAPIPEVQMAVVVGDAEVVKAFAEFIQRAIP